jgi:hypothetical protein
MIYTHVLKSAAAGTSSPLDVLMMTMRGRIADVDPGACGDGSRDGDGCDNDNDDNNGERDPGPGIAAREPAFSCYRATPSSTARATSAS